MEESKEENMTYLGNGKYLSCLCGKHKKDSNCEVYLRNQKEQLVHCEDCLAYYTKGYPHVCPPWLKEAVKNYKNK